MVYVLLCLWYNFLRIALFLWKIEIILWPRYIMRVQWEKECCDGERKSGSSIWNIHKIGTGNSIHTNGYRFASIRDRGFCRFEKLKTIQMAFFMSDFRVYLGYRFEHLRVGICIEHTAHDIAKQQPIQRYTYN